MKYYTAILMALAATPTMGRDMSLSTPEKIEDPNLSLCSPCLNIASQGLNIILQNLLQVGVVGGCSKLCGGLPNQLEEIVCNLACDYVGLEGFIKLINEADLDVFYFCEEVKLCPAGSDDAAGSITSVTSVPESGPASTVFSLDLAFDITSETGVGEIVVAVDGPGGFSLNQGFTNTGMTVGSYQTQLSLDTTPTDDVFFSAGDYTVAFEICQGECGSKHPHSIVLDQDVGGFTITEDEVVEVSYLK